MLSTFVKKVVVGNFNGNVHYRSEEEFMLQLELLNCGATNRAKQFQKLGQQEINILLLRMSEKQLSVSCFTARK